MDCTNGFVLVRDERVRGDVTSLVAFKSVLG